MDSSPDTWRRRARTFPIFLAVWIGAIVLSPLLLFAAITTDVARAVGRNRSFATSRLLVVGWVYLTAEIVGVTVAGIQFALSGFGRSSRLERWSYWLQGQWTNLMLKTVLKAFSMSLHVSGIEHVTPGPYILMVRHASMIDVLLPATIIAHDCGIRLRWILKRQLLDDPALDVVGNRLPNHFVNRTGSDRAGELKAIRQLSGGLGPDDAVMIYPEGTRFTEEKRVSSTRRLGKLHPELASRLDSLRHVLAPQPGGSLALLESGHDVVFGTHTGLGGMASLRNIWSGALVGTTIRVRFWRVPADEIPEGDADRLNWLVDSWIDLDHQTGDLRETETLRRG